MYRKQFASEDSGGRYLATMLANFYFDNHSLPYFADITYLSSYTCEVFIHVNSLLGLAAKPSLVAHVIGTVMLQRDWLGQHARDPEKNRVLRIYSHGEGLQYEWRATSSDP